MILIRCTAIAQGCSLVPVGFVGVHGLGMDSPGPRCEGSACRDCAGQKGGLGLTGLWAVCRLLLV